MAVSAASLQARPAAPPAGVLQGVERYYTARLRRFGPTPLGVDWSCEPTQQLRFIQLLKACAPRRAFTLNDLGCGYGALAGFARERCGRRLQSYHGVDISPAMVRQARRLHADRDDASFEAGSALRKRADYSVASGIFNVKLDQGTAAWEAFIAETLAHLHAMSARAFSVNFLSPLPGAAPELYCTSPEPWANFCGEKLACDVEVIAGYGLREFTLVARPLPAARAGPRAVNARAARPPRR